VLAIVHKDGARAMGDFAKTSDGFANQNKIATAQLADMQAEVGTALLPTMQGFMGFLLSSIIPAFKDMSHWVGDNIGLIKGIGLAVLVAAGAWGVFTGAVAIYNGVMKVTAAVTAAGSVAQWALNAAQKANIIGVVVTLLALLVGAIVWVATQTTFFQDAWANATSFIGTAVSWLGGVVDNVMAGIGAVFTWLNDNVIVPVADGITSALRWIGDTTTAIGNGIASVFTWLYNTIIMPIVTGIMIYIGLWAALVTWLWQVAVMPAINGIGWLLGWLYNSVFVPIGAGISFVIGAIGDIFVWLYEAAIVPIGNGIMAYIHLVGDVYTWLWQNAVVPAAQGVAAIFGWLYDTIIVPIGQSIMGSINTVGGVFTWLWQNAVVPAAQGVGSAFNWIWSNVISPVVGFITGAVTGIGKTVGDVFGKIPSLIGGAFNAALGVVKGPINGLIGLVNGVITGVNGIKVTIPSWVPIVGGQTFGLHIPHLPMLARGTNDAPDTFIAGENGPELVTGARGSTVRPYSVTKDLLAGKGGGDVYIDKVEIEARSVREFTDVVDMVKALPQVSRTGRGPKVVGV
jgi:hypothetical protein